MAPSTKTKLKKLLQDSNVALVGFIGFAFFMGLAIGQWGASSLVIKRANEISQAEAQGFKDVVDREDRALNNHKIIIDNEQKVITLTRDVVLLLCKIKADKVCSDALRIGAGPIPLPPPKVKLPVIPKL